MDPGTVFYRETTTQQSQQVHQTEKGHTGLRYQQAARYWEQVKDTAESRGDSRYTQEKGKLQKT